VRPSISPKRFVVYDGIGKEKSRVPGVSADSLIAREYTAPHVSAMKSEGYNALMREFAFLVLGVVLASLFFLGIGTTPEMAMQPPHPREIETVNAEADARPAPAPATDTYPVVKVVDGDTVTIEKDGENVTLRLIGLDTPETVDPRKPVQCFGREASDAAKKILSGKEVSIETDPSQDTYDKYGRLLAYVYLPDGTLFNEYMIAEGFGHEYTYDKPYRYQADFKQAETAAQMAGKGLWATDACTDDVPPAPPANFTPTKTYDCSQNAYNCSSFKTHREAQYVFELCGGSANDVHKMDSDKDGVVCESSP
jgi:micrococcal nuclease